MTTNGNTHRHSDMADIFQRYFNIAMRYRDGNNNNETGQARLAMTLVIVARFGLTSPTVIASLYQISKRQALEHLNKLVKKQLLICILTHRSLDGRIYICDANGAKFAEEITCMPVYFRRFTPPERGVSQNSVMHDLMNSHILLKMMREISRSDSDYYAFGGIMTEREFKRQMSKAGTRIVDGLILEYTPGDNFIIAIEIENSFKSKVQRSTILLKYLEAIKSGIYDKVFLVSQSLEIINDIKRLNEQLLGDLTSVRHHRTKHPLMTSKDSELLQNAIVYRTKYCKELTELFYR